MCACLLLSLQEHNHTTGQCDVHMHTNTCRCITVNSMHICLFVLLLACLFTCLFFLSLSSNFYSGSRLTQCVNSVVTGQWQGQPHHRQDAAYVEFWVVVCSTCLLSCLMLFCEFALLLYVAHCLFQSLPAYQSVPFQPANWVQDRQYMSMTNT